MPVATFEHLAGPIGARVQRVDAERFENDPDLPGRCLEVLQQHGVLVFPELFVDDAAQVAFSRRLGELEVRTHRSGATDLPEIVTVSLDPAKTSIAEYFNLSFMWHTDGVLHGLPHKVSVLSMRRLSGEGGDTEFASMYAAYDALSQDEKERFATLRVVHSFEAQLRRIYSDPTPEQVAGWRKMAPPQEHPLVWQHESGRRSLLCGSSMSHVVGMDREESASLLADVEARAVAAERVYRHRWRLGDVVMWDNPGCMHRVHPYDASSGRELHRTTVIGTEMIQ